MTERPQKYAGNVDFFIGGCQTGKTPPLQAFITDCYKVLAVFLGEKPAYHSYFLRKAANAFLRFFSLASTQEQPAFSA